MLRYWDNMLVFNLKSQYHNVKQDRPHIYFSNHTLLT